MTKQLYEWYFLSVCPSVTPFTRGQYWPSGIVIACVCVCVNFFRLGDNSPHVPARIIKFGQKNSTNFAQGPYCFWCWLTLTFQVKFNALSKFCSSFLNCCSAKWFRTYVYIQIPIYSLTWSCHGPWNSLVVSLVRPTLAPFSSRPRIIMCRGDLKVVFAKLYTPHMPKLPKQQ